MLNFKYFFIILIKIKYFKNSSTTYINLELILFTKQKGTSYFLHNYGSHKTNSIGSTSNAIITNFANLFSTSVVT
jgi:hypothetical protein